MPGAALMASTAALRAGLGTLKVICPRPAVSGLCALPEAMRVPLPGEGWASASDELLRPYIEAATCIGIGPGRENLAHTVDEYIELDELVAVSRYYTAVLNAVMDPAAAID